MQSLSDIIWGNNEAISADGTSNIGEIEASSTNPSLMICCRVTNPPGGPTPCSCGTKPGTVWPACP